MAIIHEVTVVPIFAPIMTPIAWANVRRPALTKLTTIIVVAVEDCMAAVTPIPVTSLLKALEVMDARKERSPSPATFCKPTLRSPRPKRKSVTAPARVRN